MFVGKTELTAQNFADVVNTISDLIREKQALENKLNEVADVLSDAMETSARLGLCDPTIYGYDLAKVLGNEEGVRAAYKAMKEKKNNE